MWKVIYGLASLKPRKEDLFKELDKGDEEEEGKKEEEEEEEKEIEKIEDKKIEEKVEEAPSSKPKKIATK